MRAFTLPEMLFTLGIGGLLVAVLASITLFSSRSFYTFNQYSDMNANSTITLDRMTREIRGCAGAVSVSPTEVVLNRGTNQTPLTFTYNPTARTLTRTVDGESEVLLTDCNSCQFAFYQKIPITNSFDQVAATNAAKAKIIGISWSCSRRQAGLPATTEDSQSARIFLRQH